MANREEEDRIFNEKMDHLRAREQKLAADLDELDANLREFRKDVAAFHVRRAHVHALMEQEQLQQQHAQQHTQQHSVADALNTFTSTQIIGSVSVHQNEQPAVSASPPGQIAQSYVDDGESLFIPEQPRSVETSNSRPTRLKRNLTFAEAEELVARKYAARDAENMAENSGTENAAPRIHSDDALTENNEPEGKRRIRKRVRFE